ncbi:MAG TPA: hypothetical protein VIH99_08975 [Bdellovibrionota bacterium]
MKTLGTKSSGGTGSSVTDSDSLSITMAYRSPAADSGTPSRIVNLQGVRALPSANLVNECGATGSTCTCEFYISTSDSSPKLAATVGISSQNNSFSCTIPASITDAQIQASTGNDNTKKIYVKLKRTDDATKNTGLIELKTTLSLEDILGTSLVKTKVRGIFRYNCNRTFFEGEGVSASQITCVASQRLGVITATYNFYTYRSGVDSNSGMTDSPFPGDICKRNTFLKIQCTPGAALLRYGFYAEAADPFIVGIQMTRAPEGDNLQANYGYAALPDSSGNCPIGLVKVRPYVAQPASIIQGSLGNNNPPSSFINTNNSLNNTVVEESAPSPNFTVTRSPNAVACDPAGPTTGDCTNATFAGSTDVQSVSYTALTPVVCAIPKDLLGGLF